MIKKGTLKVPTSRSTLFESNDLSYKLYKEANKICESWTSKDCTLPFTSVNSNGITPTCVEHNMYCHFFDEGFHATKIDTLYKLKRILTEQWRYNLQIFVNLIFEASERHGNNILTNRISSRRMISLGIHTSSYDNSY